MSNETNRTTIQSFRELLHEQKRAAWNTFPMRHYFGMMSVEVIESTDTEEGGYKVWHVPAGNGSKSIETFYKFSNWLNFEMDILRKMHPQFICACNQEKECFTENCPVCPS